MKHNGFEEKRHVHIPGTSFSSSLLNESFDQLKFTNKTLDEDFSSQTWNLLISAPYRDNKGVELSESSLSPSLGKPSDPHLHIKSPLYSLNSSKTWTDKYKSHLFNRYWSNIERSNSANPAITEWEVYYLQDANINLMNDNDQLTKEVRLLKDENQ